MNNFAVISVRRKEAQTDDDLHMRYMSVKADNRMLHEEIAQMKREKLQQEKARRAKKRMALEFAKALGLSFAAIGCIASAVACDLSNAPWWTVFAPLTLLVLTFRKL